MVDMILILVKYGTFSGTIHAFSFKKDVYLGLQNQNTSTVNHTRGESWYVTTPPWTEGWSVSVWTV